uniref:Uncharacterized protein n=1 Tax=Rhizophora mucronata TaxID=61149 RepID=A0A2P2N5P2_RHIMU
MWLWFLDWLLLLLTLTIGWFGLFTGFFRGPCFGLSLFLDMIVVTEASPIVQG